MIPLFKPYMPEGITEELSEILYSGRLAFGKWGQLFERKLINYLGTENVCLVNSYSSALIIALDVLGIKAGDEIIMSPMCCLQSTQPVSARGIKIVWADIDPNTGTLSPIGVEKVISSNTKAIFHNMHMGYVGYIDEINAIAQKHGLFTIDDCVDGMGGEYKNKKVGNVGSDATVISFHAVRLPNALEAGAITFKDEKHKALADIKRDLGLDRPKFRDSRGEINEQYDVTIQGYGSTANEISSFLGEIQMDKFDFLINEQRENASNWTKILQSNNEFPFEVISIIEGTKPIYWVYGIFSENKIELIEWFRSKGYYASGVHLNNNRYSLFGEYKDLPGVNEFYRRFLALPSGWWIKDIVI